MVELRSGRTPLVRLPGNSETTLAYSALRTPHSALKNWVWKIGRSLLGCKVCVT